MMGPAGAGATPKPSVEQAFHAPGGRMSAFSLVTAAAYTESIITALEKPFNWPDAKSRAAGCHVGEATRISITKKDTLQIG